jgi:hypothetical protein
MITGANYWKIPLTCLVFLGIVSCGGSFSGDAPPWGVVSQGALEFLNLNDSFFITQTDAGEMNEEEDQFGAAVFPGDLNGDGFEDVVVGAPGKGLGSGAVSVFSGSEAGATIGGSSITQSDAGEVSTAGDQFGAALTSGDFNGDKIEDLVVGAPGKALGGGPKSGAVFIFLGKAVGFEMGFLLTQTDAGEVNEEGDLFGAALATGDFDGDGFDELVVGAPGDAPGGGPRSGAVFIFSDCSLAGCVTSSLLTQTDADGVNEAGDRFGASLESAHFNGSAGVDFGDGFGDLAVGAPGKAPGGGPRSGAVFVFLGSTLGFATGFSITQTDALGSAGCVLRSCVPEVNEEGDQFAEALGVGDLNGDGVEELIVGAPGKAIGGGPRSGAVFIFPGSPKVAKGLTTGYYITQGHAGGVNDEGDRFGAALAAGVINEDDFEELAVGAPGDGGGAGAVFVFPGVKGETGTTRGFLITQTNAGELSEAGDRFGSALAIEDFNDNNGADLAVGAPGDAPGGGPRSGAVFIFTGVPTSPPAITEENACTEILGKLARPCEVNEEGDQFGSAPAAGDFNGDGFVDLAVGAPGKAPGEDPKSGAVFIFPGSGSPNGITTGFFITQTDAGGLNEAGDEFGTALAFGDFNGDGFVDLAVGAPGKAPDGGPRSGAVFVFPGSVRNRLTCPAGIPCTITITTGFLITQTDAGGLNEEGDEFGAALAVGDFDGNGIEDLAVGAPGDGLGAVKAGSVFLFTGSGAGITTGFSITQADAGEVNEEGDEFGAALAVGHIVDNAFRELIVGAPGKAPGGGLSSGAVFVFPGSLGGLTTGFLITQTDAGEVNEEGDQFGAALAVGDFDGDRIGDLAVGAPGDAPGADPKAGSVFIFPGSEGITTGFFITHADQTDPEDVLPNEAGDQFGAALAVGEFTGDMLDELLVGAPGKAPETDPKAGSVVVFPGSEVGIATGVFTGVFFTQKGSGGLAEEGDQYGAALAVGDFNGDLLQDLAVGAPGEALGAVPKSGAVFVVPAGEISFILR